MNDVSHRESFAFSARVLGALFYFAPDSEQTAPLVSALTAGDWVQDWPLAEESLLPVADMFKTVSYTHLTLPTNREVEISGVAVS